VILLHRIIDVGRLQNRLHSNPQILKCHLTQNSVNLVNGE
jgi:hypothetical protein